jgi:hypothetical protein
MVFMPVPSESFIGRGKNNAGGSLSRDTSAISAWQTTAGDRNSSG